MASTVWKGLLTFGMVSFPVRLIRAARKERIALRYVREEASPPFENYDDHTVIQQADESRAAPSLQGEIVPVRQGYFTAQRGYEVAPDQFVVVRQEELKSLRKATSKDLQILRSVQTQEIDPVFLETSYYVVPGPGGSDRSYALFYKALIETQLAMLAQVAMHGREHVVMVRAGSKGLIAHTMFYINEVRGTEEYRTNTSEVAAKELDMAKKYIQALAEPFRPEEFTDGYREELQALIASKEIGLQPSKSEVGSARPEQVVDLMDALRRSLESLQRKPVASEPERIPRRQQRKG